MKVAVIGATGVVGGAVALFFGLNGEFEVVRYSRSLEKSGEITREDVNKCDIAFVCVPTPTYSNIFGVNTDAVEEVIEWLETPIIVLKSTVPPGTTTSLAARYNKVIIHNPEFLTEKNAYRDMADANRVLLGHGLPEYEAQARIVQKLYQKCYGPNVHYIVTDSNKTEFIKYMTNAYLATKVIFCNEMKEICDKLAIDYDKVRELSLLDERIGRSHTIVTEEGGYGGMCLPKDVKGLIGFSDNAFMKFVHEENQRFRAKSKDNKE